MILESGDAIWWPLTPPQSALRIIFFFLLVVLRERRRRFFFLASNNVSNIVALQSTAGVSKGWIILSMIACQTRLKSEFLQIFIRGNVRKTSMPRISDLTE